MLMQLSQRLKANGVKMKGGIDMLWHIHDWGLIEERLGHSISKQWRICRKCGLEEPAIYIVVSNIDEHRGMVAHYTEEQWNIVSDQLMALDQYNYEAERKRNKHNNLRYVDKITDTSDGYVSDEAVVNIVIQDGKVPTILVNGKKMPVAKCTYNYVTSDSRSQGVMHINATVLDSKGNKINIDREFEAFK